MFQCSLGTRATCCKCLAPMPILRLAILPAAATPSPPAAAVISPAFSGVTLDPAILNVNWRQCGAFGVWPSFRCN
jgi:hypothetical protein